jgi:transposase
MKKYQIFTQTQKWEIVKRINESSNKRREMAKLGISRSTYYDWKKSECQTKKKAPLNVWNKVPKKIEEKIKEYRLSGDPLKQSPARIVEQLEANEGYIITESGVKSVLVRLKLNGILRIQKKHYHIRPKAEKFLQVVCADDVEFLRFKPRDTHVLNFSDEASYFALSSTVTEHKVNAYSIIKGLKEIKRVYGKYPKVLRLDNAQAHKSKKVARYCDKNSIKLDFITKGCPEENWPVESWHRNLNQDVIYRNGYATIQEWQRAIDKYRHFHNFKKRLRSDCNKRTPAEIAFAYTTPATQARLKARLQRKHLGQTKMLKWIKPEIIQNSVNLLRQLQISHNQVSEMCVS